MPIEDYKIIVDLPSRQPALDFDNYAGALRDVIEKSEPQFAVAIFGSWGSGKSTLMQAIEQSLNHDKCIAVPFSAWRYEKEEHLLVPLLDCVREALVKWSQENKTITEQVRGLAIKTASTIGKVIRSLLAGLSLKAGLPGAVEVSFEANKSLAQAADLAKQDRDAEVPRSFYHAGFLALHEAFRKFSQDDALRRIVVFVDDLDRCLPQGALAVLESMKLFFDLKGFVFVVGLDRDVVVRAIDAKYSQDQPRFTESLQAMARADANRIRGEEYIKKIFQVPFTLFPVAKRKLDSYIDTICMEGQLDIEQERDLRDKVVPHLRFLVGDQSVNPREVKRYINTYILVRKIMAKTLGADANADAILAMQTIEFRNSWKDLKQWLAGFRKTLQQALRDQVTNPDSDALQNLNPKLAAMPFDFLDYVSPDAPGHALLTVTNLDDYIYASEATSTSGLSGIADLIRDATNLRPRLEAHARKIQDGSTLTATHKELQESTTSIANLKSQVTSLSVTTNRKRDLLRCVDELAGAAQRLSGMQKDAVSDWRDAMNRTVNDIVDALVDLDHAA